MGFDFDSLLSHLLLQKASQGAMSELFCKSSSREVPTPKISGLEPSERLLSVSSILQSFLPHLQRVLEQQTDLQSPSSRLLTELSNVRNRSTSLASVISCLYQNLFPNLPAPEPAGGPTQLPPPQNIFQQKVYGCVVLRRFKEFLLNVARELRTLKGRVCSRPPANTFFWWVGKRMERVKRVSVFHVQRTCVSLKVAGTSVVFLQRICIYHIYYLFPFPFCGGQMCNGRGCMRIVIRLWLSNYLQMEIYIASWWHWSELLTLQSHCAESPKSKQWNRQKSKHGLWRNLGVSFF